MLEDNSQAGHWVTDSFDCAPASFKRWFVLKLLDSILRGHHFPDKLHRRGYEDPQTQDGDAKHSSVLETLTTTSRNQRRGSAKSEEMENNPRARFMNLWSRKRSDKIRLLTNPNDWCEKLKAKGTRLKKQWQQILIRKQEQTFFNG